MFKMVQLGRFFIPYPFGLLGSFSPLKMINSKGNPYEKELKSIDPKELNDNRIVHRGPNIIGKKI